MRAIDLTGQRFGRLVALRRLPHRKGSNRFLWLCRCDCGTKKGVGPNLLRRGHTKSCGCLKIEQAPRNAVRRHGHAAGRLTPEYRSWSSMLTRCTNPRNRQWPDYGGRGITVCARWRRSFAAFLEDMGPRPPGTTLDRRNNDRGYSKANCRWATTEEQSGNRRRPRRRDGLVEGQRFGRLVVIQQAPSRRGARSWLCRCDCGTHRTASTKLLRNGHITSCGCRAREVRDAIRYLAGQRKQREQQKAHLSSAPRSTHSSRSLPAAL